MTMSTLRTTPTTDGLRTPTAQPVRKVQVGALAGALVTIVVYVLNTLVLSAGQRIEAPVASRTHRARHVRPVLSDAARCAGRLLHPLTFAVLVQGMIEA